MPISMVEQSNGKVLEVHMTGKLTSRDYQDFIPMAERSIKEWGKFSLLVVMRNFVGCDKGALWEEIKWDWKHFTDVERIALVGEEKWQAGMSKFCKPFTAAEIRYFDMSDMENARTWVEEIHTEHAAHAAMA